MSRDFGTVNVLRFRHFSHSNKILVVKAGSSMVIREDPDQTASQKQSDMGLQGLSMFYHAFLGGS